MLRVDVEPFTVRESSDFAATFAAITRTRPDALYVVADPLTSVNAKAVLDFVDAHRLPAIYELNAFVEAGGLLSYGPNIGDVWRVVARDLDRIFKGAKPADIPAEQATRYTLAVNLKSAKTLGLTLPPSLLVRADEVIP